MAYRQQQHGTSSWPWFRAQCSESELTWGGQKGAKGEYQRAINRMARSTLGAFRSPQGTLAAESGLTPARALLDHHQARFAQHLLSRPQSGGGPEEVFERQRRLRLQTECSARNQRTDGSRLDDGSVGAAAAWREEAHTPQFWGPEGQGRDCRAFQPPYHPI